MINKGNNKGKVKTYKYINRQNQSTTNNPFFCGKGDNSNINIDIKRRRFLKIGQSETRIACGSKVC
jgi:hypothetical protein